MSKLECDDCGSLNPEHFDRCELCGGSLIEEKERKQQGNLVTLFPTAIVATLLLCALPGVLLYHFVFYAFSPEVFGGIYAGAWIVLAVIGRIYEPKDDYHLRRVRRSTPSDPAPDADLAHFMLGILLFPVNFVVGVWGAVLRRLGLLG